MKKNKKKWSNINIKQQREVCSGHFLEPFACEDFHLNQSSDNCKDLRSLKKRGRAGHSVVSLLPRIVDSRSIEQKMNI
ncbi:hypothetical protein ACET3Z_008863 [Daucus carota]